MTTLSNSIIDRQNILNNPFVIKPLQEGLGLDFPIVEGEMRIPIEQVARFFEVSTRTIERYIEDNNEELIQNGYEIFTGKRLQKAILSFDSDINVGSKTRRLGLFNFRSFLNMGMIMKQSKKAEELRKIILDIVIDVMNQKTGGSTKYINQRDKEFVGTYVDSMSYRKDFINALHEYIDAGTFKYPLMTNKIYNYLFGEDSNSYKKLLKLAKKENIRSTFYHEVLTAISTIETGFAHQLKDEYIKNGNKKVSYNKAEEVFNSFIKMPLLQPSVKKARRIMATRDKGLRDIFHEALQPYVQSLSKEEYEKFLSEESTTIEEKTNKIINIIEGRKNTSKTIKEKTKESENIIEKNKNIFIRLKDR